MTSTPGTLYIVATPIGNRDDITSRALTVLKSVDAILTEDTRHSKPLLDYFGIRSSLISLHAHNENSKSESIIDALQTGQSFALISDAGTPLICDPGFPLVQLARMQHIPIVPIPGACALITALCASGMPCDTFTFAGFLPPKSNARREKLLSLAQGEHTLVLYESTHRIIDCIDDITLIYGPDYRWVLAKELTKTFEQFIHETGFKIKEWLLAEQARIKGEFVLILPPKPKETNNQEEETRILSLLLDELPLKQAVKITALLTKKSKNKLYEIALQLQK